MDQRAHSGNQQHEGDRKLIDAKVERNVERANSDPVEQVLAHGARVVGLSEHSEEKHHRDDEGGCRGEDAEPVAPLVTPAAPQQEDGRAREGEADQEPGQREQPTRRDRRRRDVGGVGERA